MPVFGKPLSPAPRGWGSGARPGEWSPARAVAGALSWVAGGTRLVYFEKIRVFKAG